MKYEMIRTATFISRPNRFVAIVDIDSIQMKVHVKNTGRCRELLIPGAKVVLHDSNNPSRKYRHDLIAVYKGELLVNMDSQAPNKVFEEYLVSNQPFGDGFVINPEHYHGDSRYDFFLESDDRKILIEVKGVTLESDGICMFPDAPTERGLKHIRGLERCLEEGYEAYIVFVIQMKGMKVFRPNSVTDPEFSEELRLAESRGVKILCLECRVGEDSLDIIGEIPYIL